ncbi:MAG: DNA-directed RNA polymerase subunit alpha [Phycisphaerae bacterium]|nr:DNA-directed RNA polymerase subunit alpha [Phycisphaerae bacterium]MBT5365957.1 DNA-directed RNA polymerase subunit alpha [Phycisphaerae bacterium]MBT6268814.1 DNA-directed RNA polymerase subunit alpha [Phycisphaerae bacterium]MBT6282797.1 DNA-directed RNA polymerase subunit alpha [Phycisphaerae bacterium]
MHVRWRGLELPASVILEERSATDTFGRFIVEPFESGFGTTIGNSLRRILLSTIEGSAITSIRVKGAEHEFCTIEGVKQDMVDMVLNVKGLVVDVDSDEPKVLRLSASGPGEVTADLIEADSSVTVYNPDHVIATLTDKIDFEMELTIERGRGYVPAAEQYATKDEQVIGDLPIDASFSPVQRVRYRVENTRVGQQTNFDRLILDIWTDGTISPEMCLVESAKILRKHLNAFVQFDSLGTKVVSVEAAAAAAVDEELIRKLNMPILDLDLTVRSSNCLELASIDRVAQLVSLNDRELLRLRSFGRTSLREIKRKLDDLNLTLGMQLPPGVDGTVELPPMEEGDDFCDDSDADLDCCDDEMCSEEVVNNDNPGDEVIGSAEGNE